MRNRLSALALALALPAVVVGLVLVPLAADAEGPPKPARPAAKARADAGDRYDPDDVTAISQYTETLVKGSDRLMAKDVAAAIDLYKKAMLLKPRDPYAPYLLGEAYLASENLAEAAGSLKQAEELDSAKSPVLRGQVLFLLADVYERQKKWELARGAWKAYADHAAKQREDGGLHPASASARLKAIEDALSLDKKYEVVRQRIAAEKDGGADASAPRK